MSEHLPDVKEVQRYDLKGNASGSAWVGRHADGPFVRYDEHLDIVRGFQNRIAELERHLNKATIEHAWAIGKLRETMVIPDQDGDGPLPCSNCKRPLDEHAGIVCPTKTTEPALSVQCTDCLAGAGANGVIQHKPGCSAEWLPRETTEGGPT